MSNFIRGLVRKVILEEKTKEDEQKSKSRKKGKKYSGGDIVVGYGAGKGAGGRFLGSVNEAGALAKENPKQLMKNLQVTSGGSGLQGVNKVLSAAVSATDAMEKAFGSIQQIKKGQKSAIVVSPGEINARNGANLLHHVLIGAKGAGLFSADKAVQIQSTGDSIVIHLSPYKNSWEQ